MAKLKQKSMRNQPEIYDEIKKSCGLSLTPKVISILDYHAKKNGIFRSELVEQFVRSNSLEDWSSYQLNHQPKLTISQKSQ
jgi:type II restriction/modification system DNA methylase subunit YeeA